jgi:hypothetical protein
MKILLGYVPSPTSEAALEYALDEAKAKDATLVVLASERSDDPRKNAGDAGRTPLHERLQASGVHFELRVGRGATTRPTTSCRPSRTRRSTWSCSGCAAAPRSARCCWAPPPSA